MLRAHADAVLARLAAEAPELAVYEPGKVPLKPGTPYLLVIFDNVPETPDRLTGHQWAGRCGWQASAVGATREEVQWAAEHARAAWKGWRPVVAGRACGRVKRASDGVFPDNDVTPPVLVGVDRYQFSSLEA